MKRHWIETLRARLARLIPEEEPEHVPTLLYWRVYETTARDFHAGVPPTGYVDGYPTRQEAVIAARRMSRHASRNGWSERYCVGATVEEVADPLEGGLVT